MQDLLSIGDKRKLETYALQIVEKNLTVREVEEYVAGLWETKLLLAQNEIIQIHLLQM